MAHDLKIKTKFLSDPLQRLLDEAEGGQQTPHDSAGERVSLASLQGGHVDTSNILGAKPMLEDNRSVDKAQEGPAEDAINPAHYRRHPSGIECIEVTRHMNFNVGNAVKYLWRYMDKGDPVENLKKAQWCVDDEIRRLEGKR